jgi:hypothetical protein
MEERTSFLLALYCRVISPYAEKDNFDRGLENLYKLFAINKQRISLRENLTLSQSGLKARRHCLSQ